MQSWDLPMGFAHVTIFFYFLERKRACVLVEIDFVNK